MNVKSIVLIVLVIFVTILATQNTHAVKFKLLFWDISLPLIIMVFLSISVGFALGYFAKGVFKIVGKNKEDEPDDF